MVSQKVLGRAEPLVAHSGSCVNTFHQLSFLPCLSSPVCLGWPLSLNLPSEANAQTGSNVQ